MPPSVRRGLCASLLCLTLGACGGGGGGSGGSGGGGTNPPQSPPPNTPPPMPLELNDSTLIDAAALVFGTLSQLSITFEAPALGAVTLENGPPRTATADCIAPDGVVTTIFFSYDDNDRNNALSAGDLLRTQYACFGVTRTILVNVTFIDAATNRLEGAVEHTAVTDTGTQIDGSFRLVSRFNNNDVRQTVSSFELTVISAAGTTTVTDGTIERTRTNSTYDFSLAGMARDTSSRGFTFTTPTHFAGNFLETPNTGELVLTSGTSRARLVPTVEAAARQHYFDYQIDASGAGYGPLQRARWKLVTDGLPFGWDPNAKPEITSLTLEPAAPRIKDSITATVVATDLDGDALEYSTTWLVGIDSVGDDAMRLDPGFHEKGDVVTFIVRVSDDKATTVGSTTVTIANTPPVAEIRIEPQAPRSSDDLVLFAGMHDDDGGVPASHYQWLRNGVPLTGQTGQVLPRSQFAKGDEITALVTLDDGDDETTAAATVSIADTPAEIFAPQPPPVSHGDLLTFSVTATDYDATDTLPEFALTHGPAGMTVDPATGEVRWQVGGPVFDDFGEVAWGVALAAPGGATVAGLINFDTPGHEHPLLRTGLHAPLPLGLRAGDFDGDGDAEALVIGGSTVYELAAASGGGYRQTWTYPFGLDEEPALKAVAAADVNDADGRAEIFVANSITLFKLDGVQRRFLPGGSLQTVWSAIPRDLAVADLDGDGRPELIQLETLDRAADPAARSRLSIWRADTMDFYRFLDPEDFGSSIDVGNVDDDPALEIVTGGGYVIDGAGVMNHVPQAVQRARAELGWDIEVGDTNGDGVEDIVGSLGDGDVTVYAYDAGTQTFDVALTIANADTDALLVADIGGTPAEEIIIGDGPAGAGLVRAFERTGASSASPLFAVAAGGDTVSGIAAADFDDDGAVELLWGVDGDSDLLVVAEADGSVQWTSGDTPPQIASGPFVGGEIARTPSDPPAPIFASIRTGSEGMRLVSMDPDTGDFEFSEELPRPITDSVRVRVVDYDNDLRDEVFVTADQSAGAYQLAYDFYGASSEFTSPVMAAEEGAAALAYGDLNADGRADLVAASLAGFVRVYDVFQRTELFALPMPAQVPVAAAVANLDGSGEPEIVVAASDRVTVFARHGSGNYAAARVSAATYPSLRDLVVVDIDGDATLEIFVLYGDPGSRVDRLDAELVPRGGFNVGWPTSPSLLVEESDFGRKNLVLLENDSTPVIVVVDPEAGTEIWHSPPLFGPITRGGLHFVDLDGGGQRRVTIATTEGVYLSR